MQYMPLLQNSNFLIYWFGRAFAAFGDALIFVALPFIVFSITGGENEQVLAVTLAIASIPRFFGVLVGSVIDRLPLRLPLLFGGILRAVVFGGLAILILQGFANPLLIYCAAFFNGLLAIFMQTTGNVLVPQLVNNNHLTQANSFMQLTTRGIPLIGYGIAGFMVASVGTTVTIIVAAACFTIIPLLVGFMRFPVFEPRVPRPIVYDMRDGVIFLLKKQILVLASITALVLNTVTISLNVLMPVAMQELGWGAQGYGLFQSLFSIGVLLGITVVGMFLGHLSLLDRLVVALGLALGSYILFAIGSHVALFFTGSLMLGICGGVGSVVVVTLFQLITSKNNRGKVLGVFDSINAFGFVLGPLITGWLAVFLSARDIYLLCLASILLLGFAFINVRRSPVIYRSADELIKQVA